LFYPLNYPPSLWLWRGRRGQTKKQTFNSESIREQALNAQRSTSNDLAPGGPNGVYEWDDLGRFAYQEDLGRYADLVSDEAGRRQSLFDFYSVEGAVFGFTPGQAARYALKRLGYLERDGRELDPQLFLDLEAAIERTSKTVPA
jgi:hypothetical protein